MIFKLLKFLLFIGNLQAPSEFWIHDLILHPFLMEMEMLFKLEHIGMFYNIKLSIRQSLKNYKQKRLSSQVTNYGTKYIQGP